MALMRRIFTISILAFTFLACSGGGDKGAVQSRGEQELLASYLESHKKKDLAAILALFYQKETPPFVLDSVRQRTLKNFAFTITSARIEEIPPEKLEKVMAGMPFNDQVLIPNLKPLKQIAFTFEQAGQTREMRAAGGSIMFGKIHNVCYFVLSKSKEAG